MTSARRFAATAAAVGLAIAACSPTPGAPSSPTACGAAFSSARCSNMTDYAAARLHTHRDEIVAVMVLPPPTPEVRDGVVILGTTSGGPNVLTSVTLRDGSVHVVSMDCGGIPALQCQDDPQLQASSVTKGGYFDTPEGATPVPAPDHAAVAAARPLRVARFDIPIDHDGHYAVPVGQATLPNGILSVADFAFVAPGWPPNISIANGVVSLEVRSLDDPTRRFTNVHDHGRVKGTERVQGVLVFDVLRHGPGAVLSVRDVVVQ